MNWGIFRLWFTGGFFRASCHDVERGRSKKRGSYDRRKKEESLGVFSLLLSTGLADAPSRFAGEIFQDGELVFVKTVTGLPVSLLVFVSGLDLGVIERRAGSVVTFHRVREDADMHTPVGEANHWLIAGLCRGRRFFRGGRRGERLERDKKDGMVAGATRLRNTV